MTRGTNDLPQVVISANGTDTQTKRLRKQSTSRDVVTTSSSLDGVNAAPAFDGGNGKRVKIELSPSASGGFTSKGMVGKSSLITHVDRGFDLFVSSRGSDGEDGGTGGDAKQGQRGHNGQNATEQSDAKEGGDGGRGGDGGLGSSGGDGGQGGTVNILTSESNMHLLYAVHWSVNGGKGGSAGKHGKPGKGGIGGKGGSGYSWKEVTGHEWKCVDHGSMALTSSAYRGTSSTNLATMGRLQSGRDLAFSFPQGGYISDGAHVAQVGNLQGTIPANIVPYFQRALQGSGSELTRGDQLAGTAGHPPGCRMMPIYTTRRKPGASHGNKGPPGRTPTTVLTPGRDGFDGTAAIVVHSDDGTISSYDTRFEFQLLDFEVVDENDDGIFEPGECVIIKNIIIKNTGGMPTPKRTKIPMKMMPSSLLTPLSGKDVIFLPFDIQPGDTKTTTQEMWAKIKPPRTVPDGIIYKSTLTIKLEAVIPDLERVVPHFDYTQSITIQYPVRLVSDEFKWMDTIPQGSSTSLKWVVLNISSKDLGCNSQSQRNIVTKISCPSTSPALLGNRKSAASDSKRSCRRHEIDLLQRDMSSQVSEDLSVPKDTPEYSTMDFLIELLLTPASTHQSETQPDLIKLQTFSLSVQVSKTWQYNSSSQFLLLTSKSTMQETIDSWSQFIRRHLNMGVDVWNVSLYGGLETEATHKSVLDSYAGKTILALDDDLFQYLDRGQRSILDFIDPTKGSALSRKGTRVVSVQRKAESRHEREGKNVEQVAHAAVLKVPHMAASDLHQLAGTDELISRLHQLRENPSSSAQTEQYYIPFNNSNPNGKGKRIAKRLTKEFPLDNFFVTDSADGLGARVTHCGAHGQGYSTAQVAQTSNGVGRIEEFSGLNPAEAYSCVSGLPLKVRLDLLLASQKDTESFQYSDFVQNAALSSIKTELYDQVQAMTKRAKWRDGLFSSPEKSTKSLFDTANDNIATALEHEIMLNASSSMDDLSSPAGQILLSIIQSAHCQNTQQLLTKWFSPLKRTRSHVRQSLMKEVLKVIENSGQNESGYLDPNVPEERIKTFKRTASQRLRHKNYQKDINGCVQAITHDAIRDVKQSLTSIEEVMPKSIYKSPDDLVTKTEAFIKAEKQRIRDTIQHREWKQKLGVEITEEMSAATDDFALQAIDSSTLSSVLVDDQSTVSNLNEMSTVITLPEMGEGSPPQEKMKEESNNENEFLHDIGGKSHPGRGAHEFQSNDSVAKSSASELEEQPPSGFGPHKLQINRSGIVSPPETNDKPVSRSQKSRALHKAIDNSVPHPEREAPSIPTPSETPKLHELKSGINKYVTAPSRQAPNIPNSSRLPKTASKPSSTSPHQKNPHSLPSASTSSPTANTQNEVSSPSSLCKTSIKPPSTLIQQDPHISLSKTKALPELHHQDKAALEPEDSSKFDWKISESKPTLITPTNTSQGWNSGGESPIPETPSLASLGESFGKGWRSSEIQSPVTPSPLYFPPFGGHLGADKGKSAMGLFNMQEKESLQAVVGSTGTSVRETLELVDEDMGSGLVWCDYDEDELRIT